MQADNLVAAVRRQLSGAFGELAPWPAKEGRLRAFRPAPGAWCIDEVLEHVALANRYLIKLIEKGRRRALKDADPSKIADMLQDYRLTWDRLEQIGVNGSFEWECPAHMRPSGRMSADDAWLELEAQKGTLLDALADLRNGEGVLGKTGMSVNRLGRLDVYQYICFLALHCRRHAGQMRELESAYNAAVSAS